MIALTAAAVTRRYVGLTALRWLPSGFKVSVIVLLARARGLSIAEIGVVFAIHSILVVLLELPTGGLADVLGRRPVLVAGSALNLVALLLLANAGGFAAFCVVYALVGFARALDSGPLESWYVDAMHAIDPRADVTRGLARSAAADGAMLCVGALSGGLVVAAFGDGGAATLVLPVYLAACVQAAHLVLVLLLVVPVGDVVPRAGQLGAMLRAGVAGVPRTVRETVRLASRDPMLRTLLAINFAVGFTLSTIELVAPLRFAELAGDAQRGGALFGTVIAICFGAAAVGATFSARVRQAARGSAARAGAVLCGACALALGGFAMSRTVLWCAVAVTAFYFANAIAWPMRRQLLHSRVAASHRATTVSAASFTLSLGGMLGMLVIPAVYDAAGAGGSFWVAAGSIAGVAALSTLLRDDVRALPERVT